MPLPPGRERIVDAAVAVFAERGYTGANVREVARLAEIAPATIYHHFASKEGLYEYVLRAGVTEHRETVLAELARLPPEQAREPARVLRVVVEASLDFAAIRPALSRVVFAMHAGAGPPSAGRIFEEEIAAMRALLRTTYESGVGPDEAAVAEAALTSQVFGLLHLSFLEPDLLRRPAIRARVLALHASGLDRTTVR